jgi:hypothetical protein
VSEDITFSDVPNILSSAAKLYDYSRLSAQKGSAREWGYVIDLELRAFKIRLEELLRDTLPVKERSRIDVLSVSDST